MKYIGVYHCRMCGKRFDVKSPEVFCTPGEILAHLRNLLAHTPVSAMKNLPESTRSIRKQAIHSHSNGDLGIGDLVGIYATPPHETALDRKKDEKTF